METEMLPELPKTEVSKIVDSFSSLYQQVTRAHGVRVLNANSSTPVIISEWKQRNLERGSMLKIQRCMVTDALFKSAVNINIVDVSECILSAFSYSELFKACISVAVSDKATKKFKFLLDIWKTENLLMTFDLSELNIHDDIYGDDIFGSLSWSRQGDKVLYVAEKKISKTSPFYPSKLNAGKLSGNEEESTLVGEQYVYEEDWGEQISPKKHSVVVVCNIISREIELIKGMPENISPGQVIWEPSGLGIVGVGFYHKPRRLGIKFCSNRPNCIFYLTNDGKYSVLSEENMTVSSPRFSPDGRHLVWLQHSCGGPHQSGFALIKCDWNSKKISTVLDIISTSILTANGKHFYGIFCSNLPVRCWTNDSKHVVFSTCQTHRINSYAVNVDNGNVWDIGLDNEDESTIIFDVSENNFVVGERTSFKLPSVLAAVNIMSTVDGASKQCTDLSWTYLTHISDLSNASMIIDRFTVYDKLTNEKGCYATYYGPKSEIPNSVPVVLFPHGGPHASTSSVFNPTLHFFAVHGFGVLIVNYRGSLGCGNDYVHALLGKIGVLDVDDCHSALRTGLTKFPWLDSKNVMLFGGSHGGFLVTHLSALYPGAFKSVVTRNPAVNMPAKVFLTDIPDWNTIECGFPFNGIAEVMTNENLWNLMVKRSPMYYVKDVKTPTLLLLGKNDIRVPHFTGLAYYNALKEMKIPTRVLLYNDNHSLTTVPVEMDSIINTIIWFKRCMK